MIYGYDDIRVVHLEVTERCQASCPMCNRNMNGGALNPHVGLHELTLDDIKQLFPVEFVKQLDRLYMCGNLGDPIVADDTLEIFEYLRGHNKDMTLGMNTNGGAKKPDWWRQLAKVLGTRSYVKFGFDGLSDTNHLYRQGVVWNTAIDNAQAFIEAGGKAHWDFLIFAHNEHQVEKARELSERMGFKKFTTKKTGRFFSTSQTSGKEEHQAINRKGEDKQLLQKPTEVKYQNKELSKIAELESKYGSLANYFDNVSIKCKVAEERSIFLSASGLLLPCCWVADQMFKWWQTPGQNQVWELIQNSGGVDQFDSKKHGIKGVLNNEYYTRKLTESWGKPNSHAGKPIVCSQKCGVEFDAFAAQFT